MRIPAGLPEHVVALHGAVTGYDILHGPCQYMPYVRLSVSRGRPIIKGISRPALSQLAAFFKYVVLLPKLKDLLLPFNKVE